MAWSIFGFISVCTIQLVPLLTLNSLLGYWVCRSVLRISVISRCDALSRYSVLSRRGAAWPIFCSMIIQLSVSWSSSSLEGFRCFMIVSFKNVCQVKRVPDRIQVISCEKDAVQSYVKS